VIRLAIKTTDSPEFAAVARPIAPPERDPEKHVQFFPAYDGFDIGQGSRVDVSHFYACGGHEPHRAGFDRHLESEELWVAVRGDFYVPAGPCARAGDLDEMPVPERMHCFLIREGDVFALRKNVWHAGVWPVIPGTQVEFMMLLSGHRHTSDGRPLDNPIRRLPDTEIVPDFPGLAALTEPSGG